MPRCASSPRELGDEAPDRLRVDPEAIEAAPALLDAEVREALIVAAENIRGGRHGRASGEQPGHRRARGGQRIEIRAEARSGSAGVYAPGGRASYPSSVLMAACRRRVAGVRPHRGRQPAAGRIGRPDPVTLAACADRAVNEVYAIGGAQAIAALAYGTESIDRGRGHRGPGNRFVNEAKRQVSRPRRDRRPGRAQRAARGG